MSDDPRDEPLSELATEIADRRGRQSTDTDAVESEFDGLDVDDADVWSELADDPIAVPASVDGDDDSERHEVSKQLCHNCRFLSEPPALRCTHDGTEISEVVDTDRFVVVDCPMIGDDAVFEQFDDEA